MIPEQHDLISEISEALKLLSVSGNTLQHFEMSITFDHPTESEDTIRQRTLLPQRWFEQWLALDGILSSANFNIVDAVVLLGCDQVNCAKLPIPEKPREALHVLSELKTLRIER
jgi:hypothetical protein